jgi:hypothetical protein
MACWLLANVSAPQSRGWGTGFHPVWDTGVTKTQRILHYVEECGSPVATPTIPSTTTLFFCLSHLRFT